MGNICIIGPRASGKTTYLAGLSYLPQLPRWSNEYEIQPLNDDTRKLIDMAEDIILQGLSLESTGNFVHTVDDLLYYSFNIHIKRKLLSRAATTFRLNVRDYPGEVFENILSASAYDTNQEEFIEECFNDVQGCLLLFTEWESGSDSIYSRLMNRFLDIMDERPHVKSYRIAVAMSKCERGEIWPGRLDPETDLFGVHLKRTMQTMKKRLPKENLRFFAISTFGVLDSYDPRPNRVDEAGTQGRNSTLRDPPSWQPYNLIEPLYWLNTGQG